MDDAKMVKEAEFGSSGEELVIVVLWKDRMRRELTFSVARYSL